MARVWYILALESNSRRRSDGFLIGRDDGALFLLLSIFGENMLASLSAGNTNLLVLKVSSALNDLLPKIVIFFKVMNVNES